MKIGKILGLLVIGASISLNASLISAMSGTDTSSDRYVPKERGIIAAQDIDGDGIPDSKDDCLESNPCTGKNCQKPILDRDKDMVLDSVDKCPNTPKGFKVDEEGCSVAVNLNVTFDSAKASIKDNFTNNINTLINFLDKHANYSVLLEGHTDNVGSNEANMKLSENRAKSVKTYILSNSTIEESRISLKWYGEEQPLNSNLTDEEKEINRRVIAVFNK